ncbi:MAG: Lrp/AsnC family transcriptional regulator [Methanomassiliicoccales archaeon]
MKPASPNDIDEVDRKILKLVAEDGSMSFQDMASVLSVSKSTVHNRVKSLKERGIIKGIHAILDPDRLGNSVTAISLVRGRYGPRYSENIGRAIAQIKGVWAVYFVMGDVDFVVMIRCRSKEELASIIERLSRTEGVERSSTFYSLMTIKESIHESVQLEDAPKMRRNGKRRQRSGEE